ncbi:SSI family serine proteinase inhibitor [Streptomyces sp. TP-A0356]|uniref:SSI family serine proteinase inhibitor n=1 Tax=Streptomyces sp. TP-A0356 TaxID=1359208 RepID=UPI0006E20162|nr:SSI family serine proteinase inhibitor [Streptomyces sp. TP-A0356]
MTKTTLALRGALLAAAALLTTTPAQAAPHPVTTGNWLYLTVTQGDTRSREIRGAMLLCNPPLGHARAAQACAELDAARGDIGRIPRKDAFCPMIYAPVTVSARGQWEGRHVDYGRTFSNTCDLAARTGSVFALADRESDRKVPGLRH